MAVDDLTPYVACHAEEIEVGDVLVNLGRVCSIYPSATAVLIEWNIPGDRFGRYNGKTFRSDQTLIREAREHEIDHDFDHNTEHGGEG